MVTLLEINKAIVNKMKSALVGTDYSEVPIVAEDVSEPIIRPSIKVEIENLVSGKFNASCKERTLTARIYYFAKDRYKYKIDNTKMQDLIENAFLDELEVTEGFYIPIESVSSEIADSVLICSFDLYTIELMPEPTTNPIGEPIEPMETLEINI